jgi:CO/xanthine dehydrogenase FAD-binding subunit
MKPFEIFYPSSLKEAALLLQEYGREARIFAGGTELLVNIGRCLCLPRYLVSLKRIPGMDHRVFDGDLLKMGSLTLIRDIEHPSNQIESSLDIFYQAARSIGSVQIRNQGTLGGNLCQESRCIYHNHSKFWRESLTPCIRRGGGQCYILDGSKKCVAGYCSDMAPVLLALESRIVLVDITSLEEKIISIEDFFRKRVMNDQPVIIKEIQIPIPKVLAKGIYIKYSRRKEVGFAAMSAAIFLTFEEDHRRIQEAKIVIGGLPDFPTRILEAENKLKGMNLDEKLVKDVARLVSKKIPLFSDPFLSRDNKKTIMTAFIRRGLHSVA